MQLLPRSIRQQLPPLHATDGVKDPQVVCRINDARQAFAFYVIEFDGKDTLYLLSVTDDFRMEYCSLSWLKRTFGNADEPLVCDPSFTPRPMSEVLKEYEYWFSLGYTIQRGPG